MSKALRVGLVGAGFIARFQLQAMQHVRGMEVTGVMARKGAPALAKLAHKMGFGEPVVYKSVYEMAKHVDCVAVFCPNFARIPVVEEIIASVKAGAHLKGVICEKPLGRTVAEARRLVELAADAHLPTAYFENQIFMKAIRAQRLQLQRVQKTMGPLSLTRCAEEHAGPHEPWFWDPTQQGGGVLSDMGCHSIAVGWYLLNPVGKGLTFLQPHSVTAEVALLKWGQPHWRAKLLKERGVDYSKTPAEDFATGMFTFRNPETGQKVKTQFTNSWMFEKQGLRMFIDGTGPGYAFEFNTLLSPLSVFIGDQAADSVGDAEVAMEKSQASRGLLAVHYNEADLYGYPDENEDAYHSFTAGHDAALNWKYGLEITRLVTAAYLAAESRRTIDLTDPKIQADLETYMPLIQQGRGAEVLL
jgi:predicted dehydrogenase